MPVSKEEFLARMAAGRAKKAAERAAAAQAPPAQAAPATAASKPKTKVVSAQPVTTVKPILYARAPSEKTPKTPKPKAVKMDEATLA